MKLKLEYFLVAESFSVDQRTNRISVFNIFDDLHMPQEESRLLIIPSIIAVSCWNVEYDDTEPTDYQATLKIHYPGGEVKPFPMNLDIGSEKLRHRTFHTIQRVEIKDIGELKFELLLNDVHQADHRITIHGE